MTAADEPRGRLDLPGTPIFDGQSSRRGLRMNKMFMSFRDEASRDAVPGRRGGLLPRVRADARSSSRPCWTGTGRR